MFVVCESLSAIHLHPNPIHQMEADELGVYTIVVGVVFMYFEPDKSTRNEKVINFILPLIVRGLPNKTLLLYLTFSISELLSFYAYAVTYFHTFTW